ncbi:hypothetical protein H5410_021342 [Solanum commersonii]|uniref:Uncharacterized protein n=1 Tax=Solanum commersonii TaxID=4109 RepID=A0A9J5ZCC2_SOLCO|nr:hypothetical protein H5410_021342 [Solanum commersonii]
MIFIGLVQVAVKPLYRLGLDVLIFLLLRDNKLLNFDDSLLAVLQSNLANDPVYFNCYPNYSIDINNQNVIDTLTLNVKTKNINSKDNTREIIIIYRVYYRLMNTTLAPKAKIVSNEGVTMLMKANHNHNNTFFPNMIKWDDVLTKYDWQASSSRIISFSRPSFSITKEEDEISLEEIYKKLKGVDFSEPIPKVEYELRNSKPIKSTSPTASKIQEVKDSLSMIRLDEPFEPDINYLNKLWTRKLDDQIESFNMLLNKCYTTNNKVVESTILPIRRNYFTNRG